MTFHPTEGCSDCDYKKNDDLGYGIKSEVDQFGTAVTKNGGGVMTVKWPDEGIRM
jgi:hypothetical protein